MSFGSRQRPSVRPTSGPRSGWTRSAPPRRILPRALAWVLALVTVALLTVALHELYR